MAYTFCKNKETMNKDTQLALTHLVKAISEQQALIKNLLVMVHLGKDARLMESQELFLKETQQSLDAVRSILAKPPSQP